MATKILRYNLEQFENIGFQGFDYKLPDEVIEKISDLAMQVGSPDYVKTPVFKKRDNPMKVEPTFVPNKEHPKKRRGNKAMEIVNDEDWDNMRSSFQTTKIGLVKTGIEVEVDSIRTLINKMSDKTYVEMRNKIIDIIQKTTLEYPADNLSNFGTSIFEMISTNRHFSKISQNCILNYSVNSNSSETNIRVTLINLLNHLIILNLLSQMKIMINIVKLTKLMKNENRYQHFTEI